MTVLLIVILVPIIVFGTTSFISSSLVRHTTQNRNMKALYLAQAGLHRAIYRIEAGLTPITTVGDFGSGDTIAVTQEAQCSNVYQLKSIGTSVASTYPTQISRTVSAQYDSSTNKVSIYQEGADPLPPCCTTLWWPFSEGAPATVTGTAPYQGALLPATNRPPWTTDRLNVANRALLFNATNPSNYVMVTDPGSSDLDLTTSGTVMAWIRPAAIPNQARQSIVHKGSTTVASDAYSLLLFRQSANQGRVRFWIYNAAGTQYVVSGNTNMGLNTWYHIAGVWDSTGLRVYRNGAPDGTLVSANRVARTNNNSLYIGTSGTLTTATEFSGKIDEIYIYGCRKTDAEIKAYYNSTCAGSGATPCPQP